MSSSDSLGLNPGGQAADPACDAPAPLARLEEAGPEALRRLRVIVAKVLDSTQWRGGSSAELSRRLGLDRSLGWKIWSLAEGSGAIPSPQHVPGRGGVRKFLEAARASGAPGTLLEQAQTAFTHFRDLSLQHGSDRATADILLGSLSSEGQRRQDMALRRGLFRGNSLVLGTQVRLLYQCSVVFPGQKGSNPSVAMVRGVYGIRTTRPGVWWVVSRSTLVQSGGPADPPRRVGLDGESIGLDAAPLLAEFCRPAHVRVRRRVVQGRTVQDELAPRPMGRAGEVDVVTGEVVTHIPADRHDRDAVTLAVRVPAEAMCFDVLLHRDAVIGEPRAACLSLVNTEFPFEDPQGRDEIPMTEELADLGHGAGMAGLPDVPGHPTLLERVIAATGHRADAFRSFRLRMRFPPLPIVAAVTYVVRRSDAGT